MHYYLKNFPLIKSQTSKLIKFDMIIFINKNFLKKITLRIITNSLVISQMNIYWQKVKNAKVWIAHIPIMQTSIYFKSFCSEYCISSFLFLIELNYYRQDPSLFKKVIKLFYVLITKMKTLNPRFQWEFRAY